MVNSRVPLMLVRGAIIVVTLLTPDLLTTSCNEGGERCL